MPPKTTCNGEKTDGSACEAPENFVDPETGLCPAHDPEGSERLREAARKGGAATARKMKRDGLDPDELPPLKTPQDAGRWLEIIGRAVASGRLGHHEAGAAVRAVREWIKAHDAGEIADEIAAMREALDQWRETGDPSAVLHLVE